MYRLSLLPLGLITLLLSSSVFAAEPTSLADPFYHLAKHARRPPEPPVCCLRPLVSNDPMPEEILSFEEWKVKQEQALQQQGRADGSKARDATTNAKTHSSTSDSQKETRYEGGTTDGPPPLEPPSPPPPHFRVPLTDRFNYASLDCSARVHYAHRSARSASSLLSSKKDKYMLSPCNTHTPPGEDHFVVVELCEDIRIDTVQLANFEFFSGVFKDFSVSVARTYTTDHEGWTPAGTYRAKNIRGIQSFHPPTSLSDFYRFIRIDFHSYYGNEYYCPISLLRVYGLTHLEQWKWEVWEAEYKAKNEAQASMRSIASTAAAGAVVADTARVVKEGTDRTEANSIQETPAKSDSPPSETTEVDSSVTKPVEPSRMEESGTRTSESITTSSPASSGGPGPTGEPSHPSLVKIAGSDETVIPSPNDSALPSSEVPSISSDTPSVRSPPPAESSLSESLTRDASSTTTQVSDPVSSHSSQRADSANMPPVSSTTTSMPTIVAQESRAVTAPGESIYRTIMTRLSMLETNSSLYLRYVEEQTRSLRDALTRLEEDVGRLEGLSKATTQSFQKIINEMDRQRRRLEREHGELQTRVDYLTDEVILEKRLGIAQLCLLLVVLVFMALTRGSRGEPFITQVSHGKRDALREWGRRQLSSFGSGEWAAKLRSGSPAHAPDDFVKSPIPMKKTDMVRFPTQLIRDKGDQTPRGSSSNLSIPHASNSKGRSLAEIRAPHPRHFLSHRPRTPTSSGFTVYAQAARSAGLLGASTLSQGMGRPRLRRASSHSTPAPAPVASYSLSMREANAPPVSAKKWAKSAHLHEIRKRSPRRAGQVGDALAGKIPAYTAQGDRDQENTGIPNQLDEDSKRLLTDVGKPDLSPREPLSTSPLQNRLRDQHRAAADVDRLRLTEQSCQSEPNGGPRIIDLDTESENWEDTSADNSEVDEQLE